MRRLLVAGSRSFDGKVAIEEVFSLLQNAFRTLGYIGFDALIHGGARGVDQMAGEWWSAVNMPVEVYPADWDKYGRSAGFRRNAEMVALADAAIIIWDGKSKGTKHTIDLMTESGKPYVLVVRPL